VRTPSGAPSWLVALDPCLGCSQGEVEVAACEGKETCILTRHCCEMTATESSEANAASGVVSNAKSHTSAHRRESCATRTAPPVE
jgi:hypothetical protein